MFSIDFYSKTMGNHVCLYPDMFPKVPQAEIAYLAF